MPEEIDTSKPPRRSHRYDCPECKNETVMSYVCRLDSGNDSGESGTALYQCPECKTVAEVS